MSSTVLYEGEDENYIRTVENAGKNDGTGKKLHASSTVGRRLS